MKTSSFLRTGGLAFLTAFLLEIANSSASACAACYGDTSGSKMGNAAAIGIGAMVVIMFFMLSAVGGFIWHLAYRAKNPLPDYSELLKEDDGQSKPEAI